MICIACGRALHRDVVDALGGLHRTCAQELLELLRHELGG